MKKLNFKKIINGRNLTLLSVVLVAIFFVGHFALADVGSWAGEVIGGVIAVIIRAVSAILVLLVGVLMKVAAYSDFINATAVSKGWIVVRDVCNMFFVVILLIIAFATILGKEEYGAKKMLPKLVMAAILINFSKLICGLMIDFASVIMLTFVSAFSAVGAGNILDILGISDVVKISTTSDVVNFSTIVSAYIFGLIYVLIATVVVAAMLAMLVMRIVMIWILVVLSPFAFFLQAVPGKGQQYASQWWTKWTSNLIVGPVLAFFLWLSFAALGSGNTNPISGSASGDADVASVADTSGIGSEAGTTAGMAKFVIAIGMLLGGMKIAQEVGGETGSILGKGMNAINKGKSMVLGAGSNFAKGTLKATGRGLRDGGLSLVGSMSEKDLATGKPKGKIQNFALQWRNDLQDNRKKEKAAKREKFLKKIGISETNAEFGKDILSGNKMQTTGRVAKGTGTGAVVGSLLGPAGAAAGAIIGGSVGWLSKNRYDKAKLNKETYEKSGNRETDMAIASRVQSLGTKKKDYTSEEKAAIDRLKNYNVDKTIVSGHNATQEFFGGTEAFETTNKAFSSMTKKKKAAQNWVKLAANDSNYLENIGDKGNIYSSAGVSEVWKKRLDEMNGGSADGTKTIDNMVNEVSNKNLDSNKLIELAKLIAGYEKGGAAVNPATLGRLKNALIAKGQDPAQYANQVLTQYKKVGSDMELKSGSGGLQYDTFAKNVANEASKNIMGVSFAKVNARAKDLKLDGAVNLKASAGINQNISGSGFNALSMTMSSLINDELKSLQSAGGSENNDKIRQLQAARARLDSGNVSGLSLKNTDVSYKGATDSEKRQAEYNTTQHENMHQAGAKNEELVYDSADALQESKLIGRIPGTSQRYDEEIGKLIAGLEKTNTNPEAIREAVAKQIDSWQPASNAQRVVETEEGKRDTMKDVLSNPGSGDQTKVIEAIDHLGDQLTKPAGTPGASDTLVNMSIRDRSFFIRTFDSLKKTIAKSDEMLSDKIKPLVAMATERKKK